MLSGMFDSCVCVCILLSPREYNITRRLKSPTGRKKKLGEGRKAIREWLGKKTLGNQAWPPVVLNWRGAPDFPGFEAFRTELLSPGENPLA
jgi:hypothetical protein